MLMLAAFLLLFSSATSNKNFKLKKANMKERKGNGKKSPAQIYLVS
jgi:hypothetical protein